MDKPLRKYGHLIENSLAIFVLSLCALLLILNMVLRVFGFALIIDPGYVQYLVLWTALIGAMITTREQKHLSLGLTMEKLKGRLKSATGLFVSFINVTVLTVLFFSSLACIFTGFDFSDKLAGRIPFQLLLIVMPLSFLVMLIRFLAQSSGRPRNKVLVALGILLGVFLSFNTILQTWLDLLYGFNPESGELAWEGAENLILIFDDLYGTLIRVLFWPVLLLLITAAVFGAPIFIILGGITILLYTANPLSVLSNISYEAVTSLTAEQIPAIPLFTLTGFILSESKAGQRFIHLFNLLLGWLPGGMAIVTVLVCGFFTTFTGATGVTILALGGILSFALKKSRYTTSFSEGLLTSAGSIGLLFFPSLPLIMYGVKALVNIKALFIGGLIPGALMMLALVIMVIIYVSRNKVERGSFKPEITRLTVLKMILEILLPFLVIISFLSGFTTLIETGAVAVVYILIVEVCIPGDISFRELPGVFLKALPVLGGILIIMATAQGLNSYIVDAEIPFRLAEWMDSHVSSRLVFLMLLNIALLVTGCFMDIFSAILVVAPLVIVLGDVYQIDQVHMGIIFLANLQLGYLTPPVGLNLFLASYRFEAPLSRLYKDVLPFFIALLIAVLLITYVPFLTTGLLKVFHL